MPDEPRDIYEVANQLGGYVDMSTPNDLAAFLLRESREAAILAERLEIAEAHVEQMTKALRVASGRLTWCVSARPGVQTEDGAKLVTGWADEAVAALVPPVIDRSDDAIVRRMADGNGKDGDRPA